MNVGNLATLPGNAAFVLEPVAWGQEVVAGALVQAQESVAAPVMVPAAHLQGLGVDLLAAGVFHL
jgi:NAD(P)H-nitrite reductase large subunit